MTPQYVLSEMESDLAESDVRPRGSQELGQVHCGQTVWYVWLWQLGLWLADVKCYTSHTLYGFVSVANGMGPVRPTDYEGYHSNIPIQWKKKKYLLCIFNFNISYLKVSLTK